VIVPDGRRWDAAATIEVNGTVAGPFELDVSDPVTIGRAGYAGLSSPSPRIEVPRELARLRATRSGWVLENEGTTVGRHPFPVRVKGAEVLTPGGALFAPHAWVLLGPGAWVLEWDVGVRVTVRLWPNAAHEHVGTAARDRPRRGQAMATIVPEAVTLSGRERRSMVALFAYWIRAQPQPREPYAEAAQLLDPDPKTRSKTRALVKSQLRKVVARINRRRHADEALSPLELDEIGRYLVDLTDTIGLSDLEDEAVDPDDEGLVGGLPAQG
jgi:hypothetical protein